MKTDYLNAKILSHRANLQRYATLLATQLTELEREYLHKRIEEERAEVASLEFARAVEAAQAKETVTVPNPLPPHAGITCSGLKPRAIRTSSSSIAIMQPPCHPGIAQATSWPGFQSAMHTRRICSEVSSRMIISGAPRYS